MENLNSLGRTFHNLSSPVRVNQLILRNRLVMPPMATAKCLTDGSVTDELCQYYEERAVHSGMGLIIVEHSYVTEQGKASANQLSMGENADISGLRRLTDTIQNCDVPVFAQINHAGSAALPDITGMKVIGPSALLHPWRKVSPELPEAMSAEQIRQAISCFASAALRAKEAGFDGVEIHAAHGYLLNQFYSPLTNQRSDAYGPDSVENRIRMAVETLRAVREAVGASYPVAVRLGGCDYMAGGSSIADCVEACAILEREGVDLLDLSGGMCAYRRPDHTEPGYFRDMTTAVKQRVSVPVVLTGGVTRPEEAETLLAQGAADLVGIGRAILKTAKWF